LSIADNSYTGALFGTQHENSINKIAEIHNVVRNTTTTVKTQRKKLQELEISTAKMFSTHQVYQIADCEDELEVENRLNRELFQEIRKL
jgi:hypothetical protein